MSRIDRSKINIAKQGFRFEPFRPTAMHETSLASAKLKNDTELIAFERGGQRRAVLLSEAMYHHIVQGELAGEPYLVTF
ncbi:hypothetical protein [Candidatus Leptofilum sp.]|uniref:hypothetical protein n=1 Tax=Candidatus Leptofilum sp. TaxID=3241576 RepID=UPI003B5BBE64